MPNIEIKQLFNYRRFPDLSNQFIPIIFYVPIGIILSLLRLIILLTILLISRILPSNSKTTQDILLKLLCITFGISIHIDNTEKKDDVELFISNQISILDNLVVHILTGCISPAFKDDVQISSLFGTRFFGFLSNVDSFKTNITSFINQNKVPLFVQPESKITNGKAILKFSTWPFSLCKKIQPIVVRVKRPLLNISISTLDASYWKDAFFFMFSPYTVYNISFLPSLEKKDVSDNDIAKKVQEDIAKYLKIDAVEYTASDLNEWRKRYKHEQRRIQINHNRAITINSYSTELQRMGSQVKEVLPMVPMNDILKDLVKTRNVDITITNILEGNVRYIPEQIPSISSSSTSNSTSQSVSSCNLPLNQNTSRDVFNTACSSFGKSPSERSLSFQERKQLLIENARQRYIEKHGLNIVALNNC